MGTLSKKYYITTSSGTSPIISRKIRRDITIINDVNSTGRVFFGINEYAVKNNGLCIEPGENITLSRLKSGADIYMCTDTGTATVFAHLN